MKQSEVTREQFAQWSFEQDRAAGLYPAGSAFRDVPEDERRDYLEEADYYISGKSDIGWPDDILKRLDK